MGCLKRSDSSGVYVADTELQMQELMSALGPDVGSVCPSAPVLQDGILGLK